MKVGLIRCAQTEDMCPAFTCLKVMSLKKGAFEGIEEEIELVGVNTCGGCPGKKAVTRAMKMVKLGAEAIAIASCMSKGTPIGFVCPHIEQIRESLNNKLGDSVKVFEYTHK